MLGRFFSSLRSRPRRRIISSVRLESESLEIRSLLTGLGDPPTLEVQVADAEMISGVLSNDSPDGAVYIDVDHDNDGSIDGYASISPGDMPGNYSFDYSTIGLLMENESMDFVLIPGEVDGVHSQTGPSTIVTIVGASTNSPPAIDWITSEFGIVNGIASDAEDLAGVWIQYRLPGESTWHDSSSVDASGNFSIDLSNYYDENGGSFLVSFRAVEVDDLDLLTSAADDLELNPFAT